LRSEKAANDGGKGEVLMNDDDLVRLTTRFYQALKALAGNDVTQFNYFLEELREQGVYVALSDWKVLERPRLCSARPRWPPGWG
jgi:hypothetical protein